MRANEFITELAAVPIESSPGAKAWDIVRKPGLPESELVIYREGDKVKVDATVGGGFNKDDDAEYAPDAVSLVRTWLRVTEEELPKFVRDTDTSIKIEAFGRRAGIYARSMPKILAGLQAVNPGWVYNKPWANSLGAMLFTFSNYNYDKPKDKWIDKRAKL